MNNPVYLVVEPIEIIAYDLALNVSDYDESATVLVALTFEAACETVQGYPDVKLAFVHLDPSSFSKTALARVLDDRGAKVVFTGDSAERNPGGLLVLHRPFSSQTIAELLARTEISERA